MLFVLMVGVSSSQYSKQTVSLPDLYKIKIDIESKVNSLCLVRCFAQTALTLTSLLFSTVYHVIAVGGVVVAQTSLALQPFSIAKIGSSHAELQYLITTYSIEAAREQTRPCFR